MTNIFQWLNAQLLRMDWLSELVGFFVTGVCKENDALVEV